MRCNFSYHTNFDRHNVLDFTYFHDLKVGCGRKSMLKLSWTAFWIKHTSSIQTADFLCILLSWVARLGKTWQHVLKCHGISNLRNACPQYGDTRDEGNGLPAFLLAALPDPAVCSLWRFMTPRLMLTCCISPLCMKSCELLQMYWHDVGL